MHIFFQNDLELFKCDASSLIFAASHSSGRDVAPPLAERNKGHGTTWCKVKVNNAGNL